MSEDWGDCTGEILHGFYWSAAQRRDNWAYEEERHAQRCQVLVNSLASLDFEVQTEVEDFGWHEHPEESPREFIGNLMKCWRQLAGELVGMRGDIMVCGSCCSLVVPSGFGVTPDASRASQVSQGPEFWRNWSMMGGVVVGRQQSLVRSLLSRQG